MRITFLKKKFLQFGILNKIFFKKFFSKRGWEIPTDFRRDFPSEFPSEMATLPCSPVRSEIEVQAIRRGFPSENPSHTVGIRRDNFCDELNLDVPFSVGKPFFGRRNEFFSSVFPSQIGCIFLVCMNLLHMSIA